MKRQGWGKPNAQLLQDWARSKTGDGAAERGGHLLVGAMPESAGSPGGAEGTQTALELEVPSRGSSPCSEQVPGSTEVYPAEGLEGCPGEAPVQYGVSYPCILRQNQVLLTALEELQIRCASLKKENNLLRKTCFPETQEKVRHLKRKNAELAVIAKRLEERARKLQEANLRVVNAPINVKSSCAGLCKRALARQRATDLQEQANALLMKDKQINALQRECQELQAKIMGGKEGPPCLPLLDFQHLLQESQKEVLRLQRQIAVKNFKAALEPGGQGSGDISLAFAMNLGLNTSARTTCSNGFSLTRVSQPWEELCIAVEETNQSETGVFPFARVQDREETLFSAPEVKEQVKHLESELTKKRKQCELLEHEVKKKHKRCAELEIELQEVRSDNARLSEENAVLQGQVEWTEKVESENADLRLQVSVVTEERDLALQKTQELQDRLENLGQALKHMRDVAERRQQLEHQHEKALQALQKKKDEVQQLQQAQAEARKEHEGAVQLLEARVRELENQCRSHTEQFNFLSQELSRFRLQTGKLGLPSTSSFCSSLVTSEIVFATCQNSPQFSDGFKQKDPEIVPVSPRSSRKVQNEDVERFSPMAVRFMDPVVSPVARSPDMSSPPVASKKSIKKLEAQSSSSRSESMHNSPKSCPTPEVDTASEMEELDTDSISLVPEQENHDPVKLQVFLARYSYNPFDGPNENPEAELPLTAGEYIYVYGEMDEDGFFEGELMDGRRGLVPSNFVERLADDDLVTFLPQELHDLSQSSPLERSFLSISVSSGERSDYSLEELNASTLRLEGDQGEGGISTVVPYPRKVTLIKQFASSLLVTWDPPLVPSGSCLDVQSYNVYVDTELRENVKASSQMKAMIDKLDLKTKAYRISIQSISEKGSSDRLQCTFLVGCGFVLAPSQLQVRNVKATSVELSWMSSNSNFPHTIYLNGGACDIVKAGIYWYTFRNLNPNTSYIATVEVQPQQTFWKPFPEVEEQVLSTEIQFTTSLAGSPDAPLDVRVDPGPTSGILVISWLPVTIDAEGSSNGVRVTGYAVYADGQKVMEVTSPTAGSVLIEISQLQILQLCQEVTVRTVSLYGESVDSVPAQIPFTLLKEVDHSSASQLHCHPSRPLGGEAQALLVTRISQVPGKELPSATKNSVAKLTLQPTITSEKSGDHVHSETSSNIKAPLTPMVQAVSPELGTLPREEENYVLPPAGSVVKEDLAVLRKATKEESGEDNQELLLTVTKLEPHVSDNSASSLETCESCSAEQGTNAPSEREPDNNQSSLEPKIVITDRPSIQEEDGTREMGQNEGQTPESLVESSGRMKLLKEGSRDDSSQLVPKIRREQGEKRSDPGNRPLNLLTDHNRGSDLSDITEEEEEEDEREEEEEKPVPGRPGEMKRKPSEYCSRENGDKLDLGDTDSDEEILERILEMPLQKNCSKVLFSIPEVTEEEEEQEQENDDDEEGWEPVLNQPISIPLEKKTMESFQSRLPNHTRRMQGPLCSWSKRNHNLSELILPEKTLLQKYRGGCMNETSSCSVRWDGEDMTYQWDDRKKPSRSPLLEWRRSSHGKERTRVPPQGHRKQKRDIREPSVSMRSNSYYTGGGLYRAQSLTENLDVITSLEVEDDLKLCSWARQRPDQVPPRKMMPQEKRETAVQGLPRCLSPENLEIDIEYDSNEEEDLTITSTPVSLMSSDGRADGSPTDCEEEWSDCSSQSGSVQSSGQRELKRSSSWEGESTDWSISPSHSPGHCGWRKKVNVAPEEWNRTREKSPSVLGVRPEQAWKEGPLVQTWVTGSPRLLDSTSYQSPVQRSRRSARKSQEGTAPLGGTIGTWRSPSLESADDKGSARLFVALFDYDPVSMSPNRDTAEEELPFQEGQILKIYGHKDADGFYRGECAGRTGFIPCNMVSELRVDNDSARKQLLEEGHIATDMLMESLGNGALSPSPLHPSNRPSKPRRSKKEAVRVEDQVPDLEAPGKQNPSSEDPVRTMVAIFDYNPQENSPNSDTEVELRFCAGDVVTVLSSVDDDGFYYGEINGQKGLVPSNFLEALPSDRAQASEPSLGKQRVRKRRIQ